MILLLLAADGTLRFAELDFDPEEEEVAYDIRF